MPRDHDDWQTTIVALHWPTLVIVAGDVPERGWARARLVASHGLAHLPVADREATAVTFLHRDPPGEQAAPVPHGRAVAALTLAEDYTAEDGTPDSYREPRYWGGPRG